MNTTRYYGRVVQGGGLKFSIDLKPIGETRAGSNPAGSIIFFSSVFESVLVDVEVPTTVMVLLVARSKYMVLMNDDYVSAGDTGQGLHKVPISALLCICAPVRPGSSYSTSTCLNTPAPHRRAPPSNILETRIYNHYIFRNGFRHRVRREQLIFSVLSGGWDGMLVRARREVLVNGRYLVYAGTCLAAQGPRRCAAR